MLPQPLITRIISSSKRSASESCLPITTAQSPSRSPSSQILPTNENYHRYATDAGKLASDSSVIDAATVLDPNPGQSSSTDAISSAAWQLSPFCCSDDDIRRAIMDGTTAVYDANRDVFHPTIFSHPIHNLAARHQKPTDFRSQPTAGLYRPQSSISGGPGQSSSYRRNDAWASLFGFGTATDYNGREDSVIAEDESDYETVFPSPLERATDARWHLGQQQQQLDDGRGLPLHVDVPPGERLVLVGSSLQLSPSGELVFAFNDGANDDAKIHTPETDAHLPLAAHLA